MRHERIGPAVPDLDRLIDEVVGLGSLLGDGVHGVLEDLALSAGHALRLDGLDDSWAPSSTPSPRPSSGSEDAPSLGLNEPCPDVGSDVLWIHHTLA